MTTKGHGKALLGEPDHHRRRMLARGAVDSGWSVRALEHELARAPGPPRQWAGPHPDQAAAAADLHDVLVRTTGCEITARPHRHGYQIILDRAAVQRLTTLLQHASADA